MFITEALSLASKVFETLSVTLEHKNKTKEFNVNLRDLNNVVGVMKEGNVFNVIKDCVIEPYIIMTDSVKRTDVADDVINLSTDIFAGFITQAFNILSKVHGLETQSIIRLISSSHVSSAQYEPYEFDKLMRYKSLGVSTESSKKDQDSLASLVIKEITLDLINKTPNGDKATLSFPMLIKAGVLNTSLSNMIASIDYTNKDKAFWNRVDDWRSGGISFTDLVFATDLIEKYKKNKIKTKSEINSVIDQRSFSAKRKPNFDIGLRGFEERYNIVIVSTEDKPMLDNFAKGNIYQPQFKEELLSAIRGVILIVVDPDYERINVMFSQIGGITPVTFKALQKRKNNKNDDITSLVKSLMMNSAPTL